MRSEAHYINYSSLCTNINTGSLLHFGCSYTGFTRQHLRCITLKLVVSTFILIMSSVILKRFTTTLNIQEHLYFMFFLLYFVSKSLEQSSNFVDYRKHETRQGSFEGVIYCSCSDCTPK